MALKIHKVRNLFSEKAKHQTTSEILTLSLSIKNKPNMAYSRDLSKMAGLWYFTGDRYYQWLSWTVMEYHGLSCLLWLYFGMGTKLTLQTLKSKW